MPLVIAGLAGLGVGFLAGRGADAVGNVAKWAFAGGVLYVGYRLVK